MFEIAIVLSGLLFALVVERAVRYHSRMKAARREVGELRDRLLRLQGARLKLPKIELKDVDSMLQETDIGPTLEAEVHFVGAGSGQFGSTSDTEAWLLAALAKRCRRIFEFGTATGRTAYLLAKNSPPDATVYTITLPNSQPYREDTTDSAEATDDAKRGYYDHFLYCGTPVEAKVRQLFGDSKALEEQSLGLASFDLIFVDGSHAYSYVKSDTEKALRMIRPNGVILWHDYRDDLPHLQDVRRYLEELGETQSVRWIRGTSLAYLRAAQPARN